MLPKTLFASSTPWVSTGSLDSFLAKLTLPPRQLSSSLNEYETREIGFNHLLNVLEININKTNARDTNNATILYDGSGPSEPLRAWPGYLVLLPYRVVFSRGKTTGTSTKSPPIQSSGHLDGLRASCRGSSNFRFVLYCFPTADFT